MALKHLAVSVEEFCKRVKELGALGKTRSETATILAAAGMTKRVLHRQEIYLVLKKQGHGPMKIVKKKPGPKPGPKTGRPSVYKNDEGSDKRLLTTILTLATSDMPDNTKLSMIRMVVKHG